MDDLCGHCWRRTSSVGKARGDRPDYPFFVPATKICKKKLEVAHDLGSLDAIGDSEFGIDSNHEALPRGVKWPNSKDIALI
jgi:hypothetical protein